MGHGYDENGQMLRHSREDIETAKERVALKRNIRMKLGKIIPIRKLTTEDLYRLNLVFG